MGLSSHRAHALQKYVEKDAFLLSLLCAFEAVIGWWNELLTLHLQFNIPKCRQKRTCCYSCFKIGGCWCLNHTCGKTKFWNWKKEITPLLYRFHGGRGLKLETWKGLKQWICRISDFFNSLSKPSFLFDWVKSPRWEENTTLTQKTHSSIYFSITPQMCLNFFWGWAALHKT
jgi:hypothetical protein